MCVCETYGLILPICRPDKLCKRNILALLILLKMMKKNQRANKKIQQIRRERRNENLSFLFYHFLYNILSLKNV